MASNSRRYPWIGGIVALSIVCIILLNFFVGWRWVPAQFFMFEQSMRGTLQPAAEDWNTERSQLLTQVAQLKGLADENAHLRDELHFFAKKKYAYTIANTISRDPLSSSLVYLDAGSDDGVAVGQPVVIGDGILIGKILKVSNKNATLELLTSDGARIAVKGLDDASTSGVLRGTLGTGSRLEYIREVQAVPVGTVLVTSGLEPLVPQGLVVGMIKKITENENALFAYADVLPVADLTQLSIVSVLRGI